ncbi:MAG: hypothetical protein Q8P61_05280, partial [Candidatus Nanopelagicales bacterium]|nr:hypothetical protein [Candidatus Nanopelagicales bacterium]
MSGNAPAGSTGAAKTIPVRMGRVIFMAVVGALGGFLFGYDSAVITGANEAIEGKFGISQGALGWVVAVALLAAAVGCWFA